jgi:hypothetical protein
MHSVHFTAETSSNGVVERDFIVGQVPGVLWSPASGSDHAPLVLMGHGGGLHKKTPALMARAHDTVTTWGFTVVAIDAPGHGDRLRTAEDEQARADLRQAMAAGEAERITSISARYGIALAERAVPEWQATPGRPSETARDRHRRADRLRRWHIVGHRDRDTADGDRTQDHRRHLRWRVCRARRPPIRSHTVRRLRLEGEDVARQPGRSSQRAMDRGRQRVLGYRCRNSSSSYDGLLRASQSSARPSTWCGVELTRGRRRQRWRRLGCER